MKQIQLSVCVCVCGFPLPVFRCAAFQSPPFAHFIMIKSAANRPLSTGNTKVNKIKENKLKQDKVI